MSVIIEDSCTDDKEYMYYARKMQQGINDLRANRKNVGKALCPPPPKYDDGIPHIPVGQCLHRKLAKSFQYLEGGANTMMKNKINIAKDAIENGMESNFVNLLNIKLLDKDEKKISSGSPNVANLDGKPKPEKNPMQYLYPLDQMVDNKCRGEVWTKAAIGNDESQGLEVGPPACKSLPKEKYDSDAYKCNSECGCGIPTDQVIPGNNNYKYCKCNDGYQPDDIDKWQGRGFCDKREGKKCFTLQRNYVCKIIDGKSKAVVDINADIENNTNPSNEGLYNYGFNIENYNRQVLQRAYAWQDMNMLTGNTSKLPWDRNGTVTKKQCEKYFMKDNKCISADEILENYAGESGVRALMDNDTNILQSKLYDPMPIYTHSESNTNSESDSESGTKKDKKLGLIIGIAISCLLVIILVILLVVFLRKSKKQI